MKKKVNKPLPKMMFGPKPVYLKYNNVSYLKI